MERTSRTHSGLGNVEETRKDASSASVPLTLKPLSKRVQALRAQIAGGTYSVSSAEIAEKMIIRLSRANQSPLSNVEPSE